MNDRFAAQLRQHLLDTADERPAHDQLATVLAGVAATRQRGPFSARLMSNLGGAGLLRSATVRYGLLGVALIGALVAALLLVPGGTTPIPLPSSSPVPTTTPESEPTLSPLPPEPTIAPTVEPSTCTQFDQEAVYTANAGTLPVGVVVPATASSPWSGRPGEFELINAACGGSGTLRIKASLVAHVYADSCRWKGSSVEAPTVPEVVSQLQAQEGHDTSATTDTSIGAFRATRLDLSVPADFDATTCDDGLLGLSETRAGMWTIDTGTTVQVYVAEVDGVTVVMTASYDLEDATPALLATIDKMLATLRVDI